MIALCIVTKQKTRNPISVVFFDRLFRRKFVFFILEAVIRQKDSFPLSHWVLNLFAWKEIQLHFEECVPFVVSFEVSFPSTQSHFLSTAWATKGLSFLQNHYFINEEYLAKPVCQRRIWNFLPCRHVERYVSAVLFFLGQAHLWGRHTPGNELYFPSTKHNFFSYLISPR